jgi:hypothetical protein
VKRLTATEWVCVGVSVVLAISAGQRGGWPWFLACLLLIAVAVRALVRLHEIEDRQRRAQVWARRQREAAARDVRKRIVERLRAGVDQG